MKLFDPRKSFPTTAHQQKEENTRGKVAKKVNLVGLSLTFLISALM